MNKRLAARAMAGLLAASGAALALAQQPAPPPSFAASNTTAKGVQSMAANCAMCHGTQGRAAANSPVASLAGKSRDEIVQAMAQFKSGQKPATIMHQIAKGYTDEEIAAMAAYFAGLPR
jgi:cytochrome subunit of sulfide dehydrogenase